MSSAATQAPWQSLPEELRRRFSPLSIIEHEGAHWIFHALDVENKQEVAIKAPKEPDLARAQALREEFATLQAVQHVNIVRAHRLFDFADDWAAFTMEWVDGPPPFRWLWREDEDARAALVQVDDETMEFQDSYRRGAMPNPPPELLRDEHDNLLHRERFEHIAAQLFDALAWLRRAKVVHGDIKPANLCIEQGGRVVLLDFGSARGAQSSSTRKQLTPTYAAPEVLLGERTSFASDIYSAAVVLFELATRNRFSGGAQRSFHQRFRELKRAGVDANMARALATALEAQPQARPWATDATRWFARRRLRKINAWGEGPIVGRKAIADEALERLRTHPNQVVVVTGPAGIGKSVFANHIAATWSEGYRAFCFWGACHPHQRTPFQALHVLVNSAKDALMARGDEQRAQHLWPTTSNLQEVFPEVPPDPVEGQHSSVRPFVKNHMVLERTFDELSEILNRIVQTRPVLMVIDDAQWVDSDSLSAFQRLLQRAPIGRIRLLLTTTDIRRLRRFLGSVEETLQRPLMHVQLETFDEDETRQLARALAGDALEDRDLARIHDLSGGLPLAINWLTRWAVQEGNELITSPSITRVVSELLRTLSPDARRIVHLLAVAQRPLPASILTALVHENLDSELQELEALMAIHVPNHREPDVYALRHRVFAASIQQSLSEGAFSTLLNQLAPVVSERLGSDPEFVASLWLKANNQENAIHWLRVAARRAYDQQALRRAAKLYRQLISLAPADTRALRVELAECLALLGQLRDAAYEYLKLTETQLEGSPTDYRIHAAELLAATGEAQLAERLTNEALTRASCEPYPGPARTLATHAIQRRSFPQQLSLPRITELAASPKASDPAHLQQIAAHQLAVKIYGHTRLLESVYHQNRVITLMMEGAPLSLAAHLMTVELGFAGMTGPAARSYVQRVERVTSALREATAPPTPIETLNLAFMNASKHLNFGELEEARVHYLSGGQNFVQKYINAPWLGVSSIYFATFLLLRDLQPYEARELLERGFRILGEKRDEYFGVVLDINGRLELALLENDLESAEDVLDRWPLPQSTQLPLVGETWVVCGHLNYGIYTDSAAETLRLLRVNPVVHFTTLLSTSHFLAVEFGFAYMRAYQSALRSESLSTLERLRFGAYFTAIRGAFSHLDSAHARASRSAIDLSIALRKRDWKTAAHAYSELAMDARAASARAIALAARIALDETPVGIRLDEQDRQTILNLGIAEPKRFSRLWVS